MQNSTDVGLLAAVVSGTVGVVLTAVAHVWSALGSDLAAALAIAGA